MIEALQNRLRGRKDLEISIAEIKRKLLFSIFSKWLGGELLDEQIFWHPMSVSPLASIPLLLLHRIADFLTTKVADCVRKSKYVPNRRVNFSPLLLSSPAVSGFYNGLRSFDKPAMQTTESSTSSITIVVKKLAFIHCIQYEFALKFIRFI